MIHLKKFVFNPVQVNTYILFSENKDCYIIDPGCYSDQEYKLLFDFIETNNLHPTGIIITHFHFDHLLGCATVAKKYNIKMMGNGGYKLLFEHMDIKLQAELFGFEIEMPTLPERELNDGDLLKLDSSELIVIHVPGHSPCGIALHCPEQKIVFTGDILFQGSIGRTDLYMGNSSLLISGIKQKLLCLPAETKVFPGHGDETSIGIELQTNPYL